MTSVQVLLRLARFRKAVKKFPALETPLWLGTVKPYQELEESLQRLIKVGGNDYENTKAGSKRSAIGTPDSARVDRNSWTVNGVDRMLGF